MYERDLLFHEREYHDSYLFDVIRRRAQARGVRVHDIAEGAGWRAKHVLINSRLGAFMDHLKGDRKPGERARPAISSSHATSRTGAEHLPGSRGRAVTFRRGRVVPRLPAA